MKAQVLDRFEDVEFALRDLPKPTAGPGEVLIAVHATSVNVADVKARQYGHDLDFVPELPAVLGMDVAGVIEAVGEGVEVFRAGDEVYGCVGGVRGPAGTRAGTLAEYVTADARLVARKPDPLSFREAAAMPLVTITAWEALCDRSRVGPGQKVLVHGGAGGVGHVGVQLAKARGAHVTATDGSEERMEIARRLGADEVVDYAAESVGSYVERLTGGLGFDVVFDTVGGPNLDASFSATRRNGTVATTVSLVECDLSPMHVRGLTLHVIYMLMPMMYDENRSRHGEILTDATELVEAGRLRPLLDKRRFSLEEAAAAHRHLDSGAAIGKVVIDVVPGA